MQVRNKQSSSVQVEGGAALTLGGDPYGEGGTRASGANSCSACAYVGAGMCVQTHRAAQSAFSRLCYTQISEYQQATWNRTRVQAQGSSVLRGRG